MVLEVYCIRKHFWGSLWGFFKIWLSIMYTGLMQPQLQYSWENTVESVLKHCHSVHSWLLVTGTAMLILKNISESYCSKFFFCECVWRLVTTIATREPPLEHKHLTSCVGDNFTKTELNDSTEFKQLMERPKIALATSNCKNLHISAFGQIVFYLKYMYMQIYVSCSEHLTCVTNQLTIRISYMISRWS